MLLPWISAGIRFVLYMGFILAVGRMVMDGWFPPEGPRRIPRALYFGLGLMLVGSLLSAVRVLWGLSGGDLSQVGPLARVLFAWSSNAGKVIWVRSALILALAVWVLVRRRPFTRLSALLWTSGLALSLAIDGHAVDFCWPSLSVPLDACHALTAGTWLGGLLLLQTVLGKSPDPTNLCQKFSRFAIVVFPLAVLTGLGNAWVHLPPGGILALPTFGYGRLLLVKTGGVLLVLVMATVLRQRILPAVACGRSTARILRRYLALELGFGLAILSVTALLTQSDPAMASLLSASPGAMAMAGSVASSTNPAEPLQLGLQVFADRLPGPDGKLHDAFVPSDMAVPANRKVVLRIINRDMMPHSLIQPQLGLHVLVKAATMSKDGQMRPITTQASFTPRHRGVFRWHCNQMCDTGAAGWAMSTSLRGQRDAGRPDRDGYMAGQILVY